MAVDVNLISCYIAHKASKQTFSLSITIFHYVTINNTMPLSSPINAYLRMPISLAPLSGYRDNTIMKREIEMVLSSGCQFR